MYTHTCTHIHVHTYMYTHTTTYTTNTTHIQAHVYTYMYNKHHTQTHPHRHTHMRTQNTTHTHTHTHTHTFNLAICLRRVSYPTLAAKTGKKVCAFFLTSALLSSKQAKKGTMMVWISAGSFPVVGSFSSSHPSSSALRLGFSVVRAVHNSSSSTKGRKVVSETQVFRVAMPAALSWGCDPRRGEERGGRRLSS